MDYATLIGCCLKGAVLLAGGWLWVMGRMQRGS